MIELLINNPLLLLFVVVAVGYPIGNLKLAGSRLGLAAVLFAGLALGALHPDLKLPELVYQLGLVLFVYTLGLSSGPAFFASLREKGLRANGLVLGVLLLAFALALMVHNFLGLRGTFTAGLLAGSLTNTPALAGVLEYIKLNAPVTIRDVLLAEPVIAYSLAYPVGVIGMLFAIRLTTRLWRVDYAAEAQLLRHLGAVDTHITNRTVRVTRSSALEHTLGELVQGNDWDVIFGRLKRGETLSLSTGQTRLHFDDLVNVVGTPDELERVTLALGEPSAEHIELDRTDFDFRRMFLSNPQLAGRRLRDLDLPQKFEAVITRVRRGDIDLLPRGSTVLELGDRVRVVTRRANMEAVARYIGDSYRSVSEVDILAFSLGLALGLALGLVPIPLPGGAELRLGLAGGPLLAALALGTVGRFGPIVWNVPYSANLTLRQIGLVLFLAGVGTRAGYAFFTTLAQGGGLGLFIGGALITCVSAIVFLTLGYRVLKIPMSLLTGMLAGFQTQPAVLGYAVEQAHSDLPNIGYATVYPLATIAKIILAQVLLILLKPF